MSKLSYHNITIITMGLSLDTVVVDMDIECNYVFNPQRAELDDEPGQTAHVDLNYAWMLIEGSRYNIMPLLVAKQELKDMVESTLVEIELNEHIYQESQR